METSSRSLCSSSLTEPVYRYSTRQPPRFSPPFAYVCLVRMKTAFFIHSGTSLKYANATIHFLTKFQCDRGPRSNKMLRVAPPSEFYFQSRKSEVLSVEFHLTVQLESTPDFVLLWFMRRTWPFIRFIVSTTCSSTWDVAPVVRFNSDPIKRLPASNESSTTGSDELFCSIFPSFHHFLDDAVLPLRHTLPKTNPKITPVPSHGRWLISPQRPLTCK